MITTDRLDELATYRPDDDTPDDAKVRIPAGDLRDLVALIPVVRAAVTWHDADIGDIQSETELIEALSAARGIPLVKDVVIA